MPVHLEKHGDRHCVVEPNGEVKKCYDTKGEALAYLRAINRNLHHRDERVRLRKQRRRRR